MSRGAVSRPQPTGAEPAGADASAFRPWVLIERGGLPESRSGGVLIVVDERGEPRAAWGDPSISVFPRSSAKPFQALPLVASGAADAFGLDEARIAVCCASHGAQDFHVAAVRQVLSAAGADESLLRCGPHPPSHDESARELVRRGEAPGRVHNNCSGKHAGMIAACAHRGQDVRTYWSLEHPLQEEIRSLLAELGGVDAAAIRHGVDGCGVPAWFLPLEAVARAAARLASRHGAAGSWSAAGSRIFEAMARHPEMVAGTGRFDTELVQAAERPLLSKGGAEGFQIVAWRDADGRGVALAAKAAAGDARGAAFAVLETLHRLRVIGENELGKLRRFHAGPLRNHAGEEVGRLTSLFGRGDIG